MCQVDPPLAHEPLESRDPSELNRAAQAVNGDSFTLKLGYEGILPRQKVGDLDFVSRSIEVASVAQHELLRSTPAESFDRQEYAVHL